MLKHHYQMPKAVIIKMSRPLNVFLFFLVISYVAFQARPSQPQNPGSICKWGVVRTTLPRPQASRQGSKLTTVSTNPRPRGFGGSRPRPRQPCSRDNRGSSYKQSQRWKYLAPHRVSYALALLQEFPKKCLLAEQPV